MTPSRRSRLIATAALVIIIGACSSGHHQPPGAAHPAETTTSTVGSTGHTVPTAPGTGNVTGTAAPTGPAGIGLDKARQVTAAVHSYSYRARSITTSTNDSSQTSEFVGRAVLPDRVAYQATTSGQTFEIIRIGPTTYRRDPGRPWQKLAANKNPPAAPTAALLAVLNRLGPANSAADGTITGTLSAHDADQAGLASGPGITKPIPITLKLDTAGHVVHFEATVTVTSGGGNSTLKTQTDFADFDTAADITAPI
ncbi:MAG: hypothetical protein M3N98_14245 [Actinomycetota bacterium]|nr:hypothetical protein [Actinomycetota bacterium]